jgi:hypothetical protein
MASPAEPSSSTPSAPATVQVATGGPADPPPASTTDVNAPDAHAPVEIDRVFANTHFSNSEDDILIESQGDSFDTDSAVGSDAGYSDTTSLTSSILHYKYENGRTYHAYRDGQYIMPNDDKEQV